MKFTQRNCRPLVREMAPSHGSEAKCFATVFSPFGQMLAHLFRIKTAGCYF